MTRPPLPPLRLRPMPSRIVRGWLLLIHLLALAGIWSASLGEVARPLLSLVVLASLGGLWRPEATRRGEAVVEAELDGGGQWSLGLADGQRLAATLEPTSLVHPRLLILHFRSGRLRRHHLLLPGDALDREVARLLRMRLRTRYPSVEGV